MDNLGHLTGLFVFNQAESLARIVLGQMYWSSPAIPELILYISSLERYSSRDANDFFR